MKEQSTMGARLAAVGDLVRPNAILADVGTDHAYLPIALVAAGKIKRAIASDIHRGPIANAEKHIAAAGLSDRIKTVCCDGLSSLADESLTDIVIAGMGGMLICEILRAAPFLKDPAVRLILQPMRDAAVLRMYLTENGFSIVDEKLVADAEKRYEIVCAEYRGTAEPLTDLQALLGPVLMTRPTDPLFSEHLAAQQKKLTVRTTALASAGKPDKALETLLATLCEWKGTKYDSTNPV